MWLLDRRITHLHYSHFTFGTLTESTETICSCVCVQVSSLLWMRRERRGLLPLKPLCLGNMAARAKQIGKKRISLSVTVVLLRAQHWYLMTPSSVLVKAVCVLCWSPEQRERADSPGPSCVSLKSDHSMDGVRDALSLCFQNVHLIWTIIYFPLDPTVINHQ